LFEGGKIGQSFLVRMAAHFRGRPQTITNWRALRLAIELAAVVFAEMEATHPGGLAVGHTRQRG
jgi:hypothetical protein